MELDIGSVFERILDISNSLEISQNKFQISLDELKTSLILLQLGLI